MQQFLFALLSVFTCFTPSCLCKPMHAIIWLHMKSVFVSNVPVLGVYFPVFLSWRKCDIPASREMLDRRWANVVTFVGAMSGNDVGPMRICPSVQRWHNVVTPPTMTLCQRFANVITYCILLYFMVGTTFAHCLYEWLAKHWHNFIIAHCLSTITIKITSFIWKAVA